MSLNISHRLVEPQPSHSRDNSSILIDLINCDIIPFMRVNKWHARNGTDKREPMVRPYILNFSPTYTAWPD